MVREEGGLTDPRIAAALEQLAEAWGSEKLADFLEGLAKWAAPLAEKKASQSAHMEIQIHQGRLKEATIPEKRRIA